MAFTFKLKQKKELNHISTLQDIKFTDIGLNDDKIVELNNYIDFYCNTKNYNIYAKYFFKHQLKYFIETSDYLANAINNNEIEISKLKNLTIYELNPSKWSDELKQLNRTISIQEEISSTSLYKCSKCDSNCTFKEEQRRSADEGKTVYLTCTNVLCKYRETLK